MKTQIGGLLRFYKEEIFLKSLFCRSNLCVCELKNYVFIPTIIAMIINTHAEIVFKILGFPFNHTEIFPAAIPYIIKLKKSKDTQVMVKIKNWEIILLSKLMNEMKTVLKKN